jgi:hypothetical protein
MFPVAKLEVPQHTGSSHALFDMAAAKHVAVLMLRRPRRSTSTLEDREFVVSIETSGRDRESNFHHVVHEEPDRKCRHTRLRMSRRTGSAHAIRRHDFRVRTMTSDE